MRLSTTYLPAAVTAAFVLAAMAVLFAITGSLMPFSDWRSGSSDEADTTIRAPAGELLADSNPFAGAAASVAPDATGSAPAGGADDGDVEPAGETGGDRGATDAPRRVAAPPAGGGDTPAPGTPQVQDQQSSTPARRPSPAAIPAPAPRRPGPVRELTNGLGNATQGLTDQTGDALKGVSPELGQTVSDTGKGVSDVVRGLGGP